MDLNGKRLVAVTAALAPALAFANWSTVCPGATQIEGLDVAACQTVNWPTVHNSGRQWGIVKATEGDGHTWYYVNQRFASDWPGIKAAGMIRGAYHYFLPSKDGAWQAEYYVSKVALEDGDLPPMLDWEDLRDNGDSAYPIVPTATIVEHARQFLVRVQQLTGRVPMIYTYPDYFQNQLGHPAGFDKWPLNIATYGASCPLVPQPWSKFSIWQYSSTATVPGVTVTPGLTGCPSTVDVDRFNGSLAQLQAWTHPTPPLAQVNGNAAMSLVSWPDGHVELFAAGAANEVFHASTTGISGDTFSTGSLGTGAQCGAASSFWTAPWNYAEYFTPASNGATQHLSWNGAWTALSDFGLAGAPLSAVTWRDSHVSVFALGPDGAIWHREYDQMAAAWNAWTTLGGNFTTTVAPISWLDGHLELFATDKDGYAWHKWTSGGVWQPWTMLQGGGFASRPVPVRWPDGHLEVFVVGKDGKLSHSAWSAGSWSPFASLASNVALVGEPSVVLAPKSSGGADAPEIFARDVYGRVFWRASTAASDDFVMLGNQISIADPFAWVRPDGRLELFAIGADGVLVHAIRDATNGWGMWAPIGTMKLQGCAVAPLPIPPPGSDAGTPDAGSDVDAGTSDVDAGSEPPPDDGGGGTVAHHGCGCDGTGAGAFAMLFGVAIFVRRRPRVPSPFGRGTG